MWLAPEQIRICPLSEKTNEYALEIERLFTEAGFRVATDQRDAKVQAKIRDAQLELIPYMAVVGPKEAESRSIALRDRLDGDLGAKPIAEVIAMLKQEVDERRIRAVAKTAVADSAQPSGTPENEY